MDSIWFPDRLGLECGWTANSLIEQGLKRQIYSAGRPLCCSCLLGPRPDGHGSVRLLHTSGREWLLGSSGR